MENPFPKLEQLCGQRSLSLFSILICIILHARQNMNEQLVLAAAALAAVISLDKKIP